MNLDVRVKRVKAANLKVKYHFFMPGNSCNLSLIFDL